MRLVVDLGIIGGAALVVATGVVVIWVLVFELLFSQNRAFTWWLAVIVAALLTPPAQALLVGLFH